MRETFIVKVARDGGGKTFRFTIGAHALIVGALLFVGFPVLFIAGGLSEVLGESLQREQVNRYPSASLQVIAGAGHDVPWVKATETMTYIRAYLDARKGDKR